jgi:metal-dependent amidase/aminoacylase/carboxypeptidase family protein
MTVDPRGTSVDRVADGLDADLIALRREIHRWPELAGGERQTAAMAAQRLRAAGLSVSTGIGGHGVVAVLDGAGPGPTVAYRADMDAVAADELVETEFASQVPGAAHLCGHDLHTTIGVGVAQVLSRLRHQFDGRVVFVFQPAEETLTGARAMIDAGVFDEVTPHEIYALHCGQLPTGTFAVMPGFGQPGLDIGHIDVSGPNATRNGEQLVSAINALSTVTYPRTPEDFAQLEANLQLPDGPLARFVVAKSQLTPNDDDTTRVRLTLRTWPDERYPALRDHVRRIAGNIPDTAVEFPRPPFPAMVCSPELSHAAVAQFRGTTGVTAVRVFRAALPFHGDDFALFLTHIPGAMFYIGVADPTLGANGIPHATDFAADERAIGLGVRTMAGLLLSRLDILRPRADVGQ